MHIFHRIQFDKPDPLDDGLAEEIADEKREAGINLKDDDTQGLVDFWESVSQHVKKDDN